MASNWKRMSRAQKDRQNLLRRERLRANPEYAEKARAAVRAHYRRRKADPNRNAERLAYHRAWNRDRYWKNPEFRRANSNNGMLRRYGITLEQRDDMLAGQGGVCAMCGSGDPKSKRGWSLDHDHETNVLRGVVCVPCNTALGHYEKLRRTVGVERVEAYLMKARS